MRAAVKVLQMACHGLGVACLLAGLALPCAAASGEPFRVRPDRDIVDVTAALQRQDMSAAALKGVTGADAPGQWLGMRLSNPASLPVARILVLERPALSGARLAVGGQPAASFAPALARSPDGSAAVLTPFARTPGWAAYRVTLAAGEEANFAVRTAATPPEVAATLVTPAAYITAIAARMLTLGLAFGLLGLTLALSVTRFAQGAGQAALGGGAVALGGLLVAATQFGHHLALVAPGSGLDAGLRAAALLGLGAALAFCAAGQANLPGRGRRALSWSAAAVAGLGLLALPGWWLPLVAGPLFALTVLTAFGAAVAALIKARGHGPALWPLATGLFIVLGALTGAGLLAAGPPVFASGAAALAVYGALFAGLTVTGAGIMIASGIEPLARPAPEFIRAPEPAQAVEPLPPPEPVAPVDPAPEPVLQSASEPQHEPDPAPEPQTQTGPDPVAGPHPAPTADPLTGLALRSAAVARLEAALRSDTPGALALIDVDRLRTVNEGLGHEVGDALLCVLARRLEESAHQGDLAARMAGDEFALVIAGSAEPEALEARAALVRDAMGLPVDLAGQDISPSVSIGLVLLRSPEQTAESALREAEIALARAKQAGPGTVRLHGGEPDERRRGRFALLNDLRGALQAGQMELAYQPILRLSDGSIAGFETLLRWTHPERGAVPPDDFIPLAEESGLIAELGAFALGEAVSRLADWQARCAVPGSPSLFLTVNVSGRQLVQGGLLGEVRQALGGIRVREGTLKLEITETALIENLDAATGLLGELKTLGVGLALDDFGTGFSSLSYLRRMPFDTLKVDRSFVRHLGEGRADASIVRSIVGLAHDLGLEVVAEGVQTRAALEVLRAMGCDFVQGHMCGPPMDAPAAEAALRSAGASQRPEAD